MLVSAVTALAERKMTKTASCALLGLPRATYYRIAHGYRSYVPVAEPVAQIDRVQPAALSAEERQEVIDVLSHEDFMHLSVGQAYWRGFDAGMVSCSQRTFYRVAARAGLVGDRRRRRRSSGGGGRPKPIVAAAATDQLWSWDITELRGAGGQRYQLAVAIDVFSRYPVCWHLDYHQDQRQVIEMFREAFQFYGPPDALHADNGSIMRSQELLDELEKSGVFASYSRPRVKDDNPFSESMFKTIKYDLECPEEFDDLQHALQWTRSHMTRYANEHRHSGLNSYTPAAVYFGTAIHDQARRQALLDQLYAANPHRYRRAPQAPPLPGPTGINTKPTNTLLPQAG